MKNLKVSAKLVIGMGSILLLLIILAANNFSSLNQITTRTTNTGNIAYINNGVNALYIASIKYQATPRDNYIQEVQSIADEIKQTASEAKTTLAAVSSDQAMDKVVLDTEEFEQSFASYTKAQKNKDMNLAAAVSSGADSQKILAELDTLINGTTLQPVIHTDFFSTVTGRLVTDFVAARRMLAYTARVFLMEGTEQSIKDLEQGYNTIQDIAAKLQPRLSGKAAELATEGVTGIAMYMDLLRNMIPLTKIQIETVKNMSDIYMRVSDATDDRMRFLIDVGAQGISDSKTIATGLTLAAIVLGAVIGWLIIKQITQPLSQAITIAQAIGNRDMTGRGVEQRRDEFGALLNALDQTRTNLRDALGEVDSFTSQLASAAEELSAVTTQTSAVVLGQREETEQVATAMNEMTATVHEVARNAEDAAASGEKANRLAINGEQVLQGALDANNRLTTQVQQSADAMHRLNEDSKNISAVLTVINGLADQTNLLALNAAIEAARAGEAGRGFAVVADEVRNLAHRTQESTSQIEDLIDSLQKGSGNAVAMMDSSRTLADSTLELVQEAYNELQAIARVVLEMQAMGAQIATAAEEQSLVAEEINRNVVNVNSAADQSAAAAEETAASSLELARLGQELHSLVVRFKI
ncbi:methyl-accepting chemotaxis protein [Pseudomonas sp. C27(2019)]|nr:methyl-accepting chemotaxis protein [Pseudomonas sp. C27(2019)]QEY58627.1 methyl-accepting chemotaxis protein [Pseudomonas sp. C27(2019)]